MKKVLSVVLSLLMVFSLVSVASAAVENGGAMAIRIVPTASSYNKGETVKFEVVYETTGEIGALGVAANMHIGYDSDVFEPVDAALTGPGVVLGFAASETVVTAGYPVADNCEASLSDVQLVANALSANDTAKGWDSVLQIAMAETTAAYDDYSAAAASFAFNLKIKDTAPDDGCYVVGLTEYGITNDKTTINEEYGPIYGTGEGWWGTATKNFDTVDGTAAVATAKPEVVLAGTMARMDNWADANATVFDGGLMGQINNLPLEFDGKECTTIKSIEVFLNGEEEASANAYQVYKVDDTTYKFRAVIKNMDKNSANYATDFSYKFVVTLNTGDTLEVEGTTSAKAIYDTAKANYDASIA